MTDTQLRRPGRAGRSAAEVVAPQEFRADSDLVTAHTTLAEPLVTVDGLARVLTVGEAMALSEQLEVACAEICRQRPETAQRYPRANREESYRQRLCKLVKEVAPAIEDTHAHRPYGPGVTSAMRLLRTERERLSAEASQRGASR